MNSNNTGLASSSIQAVDNKAIDKPFDQFKYQFIDSYILRIHFSYNDRILDERKNEE